MGVAELLPLVLRPFAMAAGQLLQLRGEGAFRCVALCREIAAPVFAVPSGPLRGEYDGVLVLTDLEADDAVALKVLATRLRGVPMLVVVGEGDTDKTEFAKGLLCWLGLDEGTVVVQSRRSGTPFPAPLCALYEEEASRSAAQVQALPDMSAPAAQALPVSSPAGDDAETARERFAGAQVELFLGRTSRPLALLLKPPHELVHVSPSALARTTGAMYGSFNLVQLRNRHWPAEKGTGQREGAEAGRAERVERVSGRADAETVKAEVAECREGALMGGDGEAAARAAVAAAAAASPRYEHEMRLLRSFRTLLWIERSAACGRDCSLDASTAPVLWDATVGRDPKLAAHVRFWNEAIVRRSCAEIGMGDSEVERLFAARGMGEEEAARRLAAVGGEARNSAERRLNKIILPNVRAGCMQACHADTLTVACLVDEQGLLAPWVGYVNPVWDTEGGVSFEPVGGAGMEEAGIGAGDQQAGRVGEGQHGCSVAAGGVEVGEHRGSVAAAVTKEGAESRGAFVKASVAVLAAEALCHTSA